MVDAGVDERNIFVDKETGKVSKRPQYNNKILKSHHLGDVVILKNLDALSDSYEDIAKQWKFITGQKEADIVALDIHSQNAMFFRQKVKLSV